MPRIVKILSLCEVVAPRKTHLMACCRHRLRRKPINVVGLSFHFGKDIFFKIYLYVRTVLTRREIRQCNLFRLLFQFSSLYRICDLFFIKKCWKYINNVCFCTKLCITRVTHLILLEKYEKFCYYHILCWYWKVPLASTVYK